MRALRDGKLGGARLRFRCGFLGLLHLEIIRERLEREFNIDLITTAPSVIYRVFLQDGSMVELHNPVDMPEAHRIKKIEEPWIRATILVPDDYLGSALRGPARPAEGADLCGVAGHGCL